ncbi:MAG: hypothetical protein QXS12_06450 [Candidatus Caldarchaeum sp.]
MDALETFFKTAMAERRLAEANMAAALQRRLLWLQIDEEREAHNTVRSPTVTIYDMSQLGSVYLKTVYSLVALTKAYYEAVSEGQTLSLRRLVVAEECQNYVRGRRFDEPPSIGERIVNELRAYGVGVLLISPDPVQIPWHMARDVAAVVAIGLQAIPDALKDVFRAYDIRRLERILRGRKTYVFHNGKLHMVRTPKTLRPLKLKYVPPPPPETELPQQQVAPQPVVVSVEEQPKTEEPLRLEEEEEQPSPAPTGVADPRGRDSHTQALKLPMAFAAHARDSCREG